MTERLLRKAKHGDSDAFCRLMDQHMNGMYKIVRSYLHNNEDAADAIQDTILSCFKNLQSLQQNRYFKTWLTRILINKCKDILKKNSRLLYYMEGFNTREIGEILDMRESTVKSRLQRGRQKISQEYQYKVTCMWISKNLSVREL